MALTLLNPLKPLAPLLHLRELGGSLLVDSLQPDDLSFEILAGLLVRAHQ